MERGAFTVHRQLGIVPSTDRPPQTEGRSVFLLAVAIRGHAMSSKLPLNLDDLIRQRTVEGDRIEYKAGWNPDAVVRTLCAFANDFENLGGG